MKTVELNITKNKKPRQILKTLTDKKLSRGDRLMIKKMDDEVSLNAVILMICILVIWYFSNESKKKKSFGDEVEELMFDRSISPKMLEKQIQKEYGVSVSSDLIEEREIWNNISKKGLARAYSGNEPEYTIADVKEPKALYKKWKKGK